MTASLAKSAAAIEERAIELIHALGLAKRDEIRSVSALTGGVSSDIARVETASKTLCVKFALDQLKTTAEWHAPVRRNAAEYAWLEAVTSIVPLAVPQLLGRDTSLNGFAMEFIADSDARLWKTDLLGHGPRAGDAEQVAGTLADIHAASTRSGFDRAPFQNQPDFHALRLAPYFEALCPHHPDLTSQIEAAIMRCEQDSRVLIHGDVSPKNIIFRRTGPVFLDAECATMGDPAFDAAFCLNHLVLKAAHMPLRAASLLAAASAFWRRYVSGVTWEPADGIDQRTALLLPVLMLARLDGKSPVEYLDEATRSRVRRTARTLIATPRSSVRETLDFIGAEL